MKGYYDSSDFPDSPVLTVYDLDWYREQAKALFGVQWVSVIRTRNRLRELNGPSATAKRQRYNNTIRERMRRGEYDYLQDGR